MYSIIVNLVLSSLIKDIILIKKLYIDKKILLLQFSKFE